MNQVQLIGRMAREPELRRTEKGTPVVSFALAVDRRFQRDTVDFVDCVAWRGTAEFVNKYFRKGKRDGKDQGAGSYAADQMAAAADQQFTEVEDDDGELPF